MKIKNKDRLTALDIFFRESNLAKLSKEEIITGARTILDKQVLTEGTGYLTNEAVTVINNKRKV